MNPIHQYFKRYHPETIFLTEIKGYNSDNNCWMLSWIKLDLYFMYEIWIQYTIVFKRCCPETIFTEIKDHSIDNNQWILTLIELDLYFMILYLCMKYESNTPMFS